MLRFMRGVGDFNIFTVVWLILKSDNEQNLYDMLNRFLECSVRIILRAAFKILPLPKHKNYLQNVAHFSANYCL